MAAASSTALSPWWIYLLECEDGSLYTGIAKDISARFQLHMQGRGAKYTKQHKPVRVVYQEGAADRSTALKREYALKKLTRTQKLALCAAASMTEPKQLHSQSEN